MKIFKRIILQCLVLLAFASCSEDGTIGLKEFGDITGKVVAKETFTPLENVKITLSPTNNSTFTDAAGNFKFTDVEVQDYSVQATKEGYLSKFEGVTVTKDGTVNVILELDVSTALNESPTTPVLTSPDDNSQDLERTVTLTWTATDPDNDALHYKLIVRNDFNSEELVVNDITANEYTLENLEFGGKYFWQIGVSDNLNPMVYSETRAFTVKEYPSNRFMYVKNVNGNNVIYSSDFDENTNESINEFELTSTNTNSWRPRKNNTSNLIAFLRTDNNETHIFTMLPNGQEVTKVTSSVPVSGFNLNEIDFSWSSDGSKLIYPSFDKLYMINKDGTGLQMIHQTTNGNLITECDWSDDGSKIALKTNNTEGYEASIYVIDTSGNLLSIVIDGLTGALGGLNLSASGNKVIYTRDISGFESSNYRQLNTCIFVYDFQTGIATNLSEDDKESGTNDLDPRFSPNEAEIIFVNTSNDGISEKEILKTNLNPDNNQRKKLFSNATMPDWE